MEWLVHFFAVGVLALVGIVHHVTYARPLRRIRHGVSLMERGYPEALQEIKGPRPMRDLAESVWSLGQELEARMRELVEAEQRGQVRAAPEAASDETSRPSGGTLDGAHVGGLTASPGTVDPTIERLRERCLELERGSPTSLAVRMLAREVWESDVEIAARHGDLALRSRLDDAALRVLDRPAYDRVVAQLHAAERSPLNRLALQKAAVQNALQEHGVVPQAVHQRVKHVAGIWRKMATLGLPFEQIQDVFGLRVVVTDVCECYRALAILHHAFEPQLFSFDDYIAHPKPSGYRSLHTHLLLPCGLRIEVQIRTLEMHREAELGRGNASHWRYKAGSRELPTHVSASDRFPVQARVA